MKILSEHYQNLLESLPKLPDEHFKSAEKMGRFVRPIVEYIRQTCPDYVIACDSGARFFGLAVFRTYHQLYGRFPTADGTLRFRRFSKDNSLDTTKEYLTPLVNEMLTYRDKPNVLVLDDSINSGETRRLARQTFDELSNGKINIRFGVLIGTGADISIWGSNLFRYDSLTGDIGIDFDWKDNSHLIGIEYGDGIVSSGVNAKARMSEQAIAYRRAMYKAIDELSKRTAKK